MAQFKTLAEFKRAYKATGMHFFDKGTMRFFNSRIESGLLKGKYFITSEQYGDERRGYTLREIQEDLQIRTVGEFNGYKTKEAAKAAIK